MKFDKTLLSIIGVCFIAEPFFIHLHNLVIFILSKILHVKCIFFEFGFATQCRVGNDPAISMILSEVAIINVFIFSLIGYFLSKHGAIKKSNLFIFSGLLLFYSALHQTVFFLLMSVRFNIFSLQDRSSIPLEYFGNFHNADIINSALYFTFILIYIYMAYQIIFKMWERDFRIKIFTVGFLSCLAGNIIWYFFLGKFIYSFWGGGFHS